MRRSEFEINSGRKCAIADCERRAYCRTWCTLHYARWQSHGDPLLIKSCVRHGDTIGRKSAPEYSVWHSMIARCHNPNNVSYVNYGGRGITVCDRWRHSYELFLTDMGRRPSLQYSIDRMDSDGNYEPANCRWATIGEQVRNTKQNRNLTIEGETHCAADWAEIVGISRYTIYTRLQRGFTAEEAVFGRPNRSRKITDEQATEIRKALASGVEGREVAARYNVAPSSVTRIKKARPEIRGEQEELETVEVR